MIMALLAIMPVIGTIWEGDQSMTPEKSKKEGRKAVPPNSRR